MPIESNLKDSLEELSRTSSSTGHAKVKSRTWAGSRRSTNKESAASLLNSIMEDSSRAAEEERRRTEEERRRAEEEDKMRQEEEELRLQIEGEQLIQQEQKAQDELRKKQSQMAQKVQREKDIEAGLIDVEAEERAKREAEAKKKAEEEARQRKEQEKKARKEQLAQQKRMLAEIQKKEEVEAAKPAPSKMPLYITLAAVVLLSLGGILYAVTHPKKTDFYEFYTEYGTSTVQFRAEDTTMLAMDLSVVAQAKEEPKPVVRPGGGRKKPAGGATPAPAAKPGLSTGKGGGLGGGKLGGGLGGRRGL